EKVAEVPEKPKSGETLDEPRMGANDTVDVTPQPFGDVNELVATSDKATIEPVVESVKEKTTSSDVVQDVGASSVQPNPDATITESFGVSSESDPGTDEEEEVKDKQDNNDTPDVVENSQTEESREKI
ncbi:hypothetical protein A2U01_0059245, partial [Trifolium medium]|nr:hypothetical protein [Trifolium medium]